MITFVDLETCFLMKGFKRKQQQILEIGMCRGKQTFQCLVNPFGDTPIVKAMEDMGQHPEKSINFWTKLLVGKNMLNSAVRRKDMQGKADAIQAITKHMLAPTDAIQKAHGFGRGTWVAHNGKSFDFHILKAHLDRAKLPHPDFRDSLPVFRQQMDLVSYSQPLVYKSLFRTTYKAHHALHDAQALQRIWRHLHPRIPKPNVSKVSKVSKRSELLTLYGVGPKSVQELNHRGIYTIKQLETAANQGKTFKVVRKSVLAHLRTTPH